MIQMAPTSKEPSKKPIQPNVHIRVSISVSTFYDFKTIPQQKPTGLLLEKQKISVLVAEIPW